MSPAGRLTALLLFVALAVLSLFLALYEPYHNYDMIGYIGAAKSFEERDVATLHAFTYEELRRGVPETTYRQLTEGTFRSVIHTDPSAFAEQLPFFQIRPVYTGLVYVLGKAGMNMAQATRVISALAVVGAIVLLYLISTSLLPAALVYAVPPLAVVFGILELPRLSTPDGLAFLAVTLAAYLHLNRRVPALLVFLPVAIGIRTDLILFTGPLLLVLLLFDERNRWKAAASLAVSMAVYVGIGMYWRYPGWATVFYCTLVHSLTHPASMSPHLSAGQYLGALVNGVKGAVNSAPFVLYALVSAYTLFMMRREAAFHSARDVMSSPAASLAAVCMVFVATHFVLLPAPWERFFAAPYLIGAVCFLLLLAGRFPQWRADAS